MTTAMNDEEKTVGLVLRSLDMADDLVLLHEREASLMSQLSTVYRELSQLNEELAEHPSSSDFCREMSRQGAITAATHAGDKARAAMLRARYNLQEELPDGPDPAP